MPLLIPPKAINIFLQTKDSDWFFYLLTIEEVWGQKFYLVREVGAVTGGSGVNVLAYIYTNNIFVSFIAELAFLVALYLEL